MLPRLVRRSRLYEVTAKNMLRIGIELVGGVEPPAAPQGADAPPTAGNVAIKKAAGNVVEFDSIAAFGFSPLWLLAAAADVLHGSRTYLAALEEELSKTGVLAEGAHFGSVEDLLGALEGTTGTTAGLIDMPPLEFRELRASISELKADASSLPSPKELAGALRWPRANGAVGGPLTPRRIDGSGAGFRNLRAERGAHPCRGAVPGGLAPPARRRFRGLRHPRRGPLSQGNRWAFQSRAPHVD